MTTEVLRLGMNTTGFEAGGKRVQGTLAGIGAAGASAQKVLLGLGVTLGAAGLVRALNSAARGFMAFEGAMTQSLAIMKDVNAEMRDEMTRTAREVAVEVNFAARDAAEAYFYLASAGLDAQQSVAALPAVAEFARAGMFDFAQATDLATDAQSALGLAVDDAQANLINMTRVTDALVAANTLANASVRQFSVALTSEAGAALKTFNKSAEEGLAVLAAFADQGVKAEKAGHALSRILRLMGAAAVKNADAYEDLGIRVFDAQGAMRNLADVVSDLERALLPMSDEMRIAALETLGFQAHVQGVVLPLLGTSEAIREYQASIEEMAGATAEVAGKQMQSLENRLGQIRERFAVWRDEMVERLVPAMEAVIDNADRLADALKALAVSAAAVGAVGLVTLFVNLTPAIVGTVAAFGSLAVTVTTLSEALALLQIAMGPTGWIIAGVGALTAVIYKLIRAKREEREAIEASRKAAEEEMAERKAALMELTEAQLLARKAWLQGAMGDAGQRTAEQRERFQRLAQEIKVINELLNRMGEEAAEAGQATAEGMTEAEAASRDLVAQLRQQVSDQTLLLNAAHLGTEASEQAQQAIDRETTLRDALAEAVEADRDEITRLVDELYDLIEATDRANAASAEAEERARAEAGAREQAARQYAETVAGLERQIEEQEWLIDAQEDGAEAVAALEAELAGEQASLRLGENATEEQRQAVARLAEELEKLRQEYRALIGEQREQAQASEEAAAALVEPWEEAVREIQRTMADAFSDLLRDELRSWEDFADQVLNIFRDLAAQIAAAMAADALGIPDLMKAIQEQGRAGLDASTLGRGMKYGGGALIGGGVGYGTGSPLGGALAGGLSGFAMGGPVGGIVGAVGGIVGGFLGQVDQAEEAERRFRSALESWEDSLDAFADLFVDRNPLGQALDDLAESTERAWDELREIFSGRGIDISREDMPSLEFIEEQIAGWQNELANLPEMGTDFFEKQIKKMIEFWEEALELAEESGDAAERAREKEEERIAAIQQSLDVEQAYLEGRDEEARALENQIELLEAEKQGYTDAQLAQLEHIQALREEERAAKEAAEQLRGLRDFQTILARAQAEAAPEDVQVQVEAQRTVGEIEIARTVEGFQELADAGILTQAEVDALATILTDNLNAALKETEEAAKAAARQLAFQGEQFRAETSIRALGLQGMDREAFIAELNAQAEAEIFAARQLMDEGIITMADFMARTVVIWGEVEAAIDDFDQAAQDAAKAAREAAEAERYRAWVDQENLRVRLMVAQGRDAEAQALRNQLEIMDAIREGRDAEYIALLEQIHAAEAARDAHEEQTRAVERTTEAVRNASQALNAPQGLRLSLLRWRASAESVAEGLGGSGGRRIADVGRAGIAETETVTIQPDVVAGPTPTVDFTGGMDLGRLQEQASLFTDAITALDEFSFQPNLALIEPDPIEVTPVFEVLEPEPIIIRPPVRVPETERTDRTGGGRDRQPITLNVEVNVDATGSAEDEDELARRIAEPLSREIIRRLRSGAPNLFTDVVG